MSVNAYRREPEKSEESRFRRAESAPRRLSHADAIGNADARYRRCPPGAGREWRRRAPRFRPGAAGWPTVYCAMERGQRKMRVKRGRGAEAGDLVQLARHRGDDGVVGFVEHAAVVHAAQKAARTMLPAGHAVRELGAHPGAGHQAAAFVLGHQKAEADRAAWAKSRGVEAQRHGHRGAVGTVPSSSARRPSSPPAGRRRCALRRPAPAGALRAKPSSSLMRKPPLVRSTVSARARAGLRSCP